MYLGGSSSNDGDVSGGDPYSADYWVVKLNSLGNIEWEKSLGGSDLDFGGYSYSFHTGEVEFKIYLEQTTDEGYIIAGSSYPNDGDVYGNHGVLDFWIVKLSPDQMSTSESNSTEISIYPNPVNDILHFSEKLENIQIYNLSGQMIFETINKSSIKVSHLNSGTYILKAKSQKGENISIKIPQKLILPTA